MNAFLPSNGFDLWQVAGWTMIHFLWLGAIVGVVAAVGRLALRRAAPGVRYAFLLGCFTALAALPLGIATWTGKNSPPLKGGARGGIEGVPGHVQSEQVPTRIVDLKSARVAAVVESQPDNDLAIAGPTINEPSPNPSLIGRGDFYVTVESWVSYLPWLWIVGTPLTFAVTATGIVGTRRLRRASRAITDGPIAELLERLAASMRLGRRVTVTVCDRIAAPVLIGILRPIILLPPAALTGWSPDEIEMVLLHELAHVRRWDNLINLLQRFVESLLFFHPAVWLMSSWIRREREACCDAVVIGRTNQPHAYAELLVALAAQMPRSVLFHPAASSAMAAGPLRGRIRRILGLQDDPMLISGNSLAIALAGFVVIATLAGLYVPTSGQAEESSTSVADNSNKSDPLGNSADSNEQVQTKNNLKNIGLALLNYQAAKLGRAFPADAICSEDGKPLLSWRVAILPFISKEGSDLYYNEFHLKEPWDSEHNRKLIARMPEIFKNPKISEPGKTNYLAVIGDECFMTGTPRRLAVKDITDGTSKTIAVVEANEDMAVEWTRPVDWKFDRDRPTLGLGSLWGDHWYHTRVDGSVHRVANSEPPDEIGILFTRNGREVKRLAESAGRAVVSVVEGALDLAAGGEPAAAPPVIVQEQGTDLFGPVPGQAAAAQPARAAASDDLISLDSGQPASAQPAPAASNDDWPMGVVFPSPKEGEISKRAWKELGLKVVPASEAELVQVRPYGWRGGLKLQDFREFPHLEGPFILTEIQSKSYSRGIVDFGDLEKVLDEIAAHPRSDLTILNGAAKNGKFNYSMRLPTPAKSKVATRFPSLEDQKLADVAYKRLGLELEAIDQDDLKRVKSLGYDGGLKVSRANSDPGGIQYDDILVGLHVWPTTSLQDVAEVLRRDDLPELNPLKFYVVRRNQVAGPMTPNEDIVFTGRVPVKADGQIIINKAGEQPAKSPYSYLYSPVAPTPPPANAVPIGLPDGTHLPAEPQAAPAPTPTDPVGRGSDWTPLPATPTAPTVTPPAPPSVTSPNALPVPTIPRAQVPTPTIPRAQVKVPTIPRAQLQPTIPGTTPTTPQSTFVPSTRYPGTPGAAPAPTDAATIDGFDTVTIEGTTPDGQPIYTQQAVPRTKRQSPPQAVGSAAPIETYPTPTPGEPSQAYLSLEEVIKQRPLMLLVFEKLPDAGVAPGLENEPLRKVTKLLNERLGVALLYVNAERDYAAKYKVKETPTYVLLRHGKEVKRAVGRQSSEQLIELVASAEKAAIEGQPLEPTRSLPAKSLSEQPFFLMFFYSADDRESSKVFEDQKKVLEREFPIGTSFVPTQKDSLASTSHGVDQLPTYVLYYNGKRALNLIGMQSTDQLLNAIAQVKKGSGLTDEKASTNTQAAPDPFQAQQQTDAQMENDPVMLELKQQLSETQMRLLELDSRSRDGKNADLGRKAEQLEQQIKQYREQAQQQAVQKAALRYDGKNFDEWQAGWKTELSTGKRVEAVKALAAFGANGFGRQAAQDILEIAGQYDWTSIGGNKLIEPLQNACVEALVGPGLVGPSAMPQSIPVKDSMPAISVAVQSGNQRQKLFLTYVLLYFETPESIELRLMLSQDQDATVRKYALPTLPTFGYEGHDEKVSKRIREALKSDNTDEVAAAMRVVWPSKKEGAGEPYPYLSELAQWIFSPHEPVRRQARNLATGLRGDDAIHIADVALAVLKDDSKKEQHIEAIRPLAALGPHARSAVDTLRPLLKSRDQQLAIAASAALSRILKPADYNKLVYDELGKRFELDWNGGLQLRGNEEYEAFRRAANDELRQLFP